MATNNEHEHFMFGKVIDKQFFTDRDEERARLKQNIVSGINSVIISPRRWGKSSLVYQLKEENTDKKTKYCYLDLFSIKDEEDFYKQYSIALVRAVASTTDEIISNTTRFLKNLMPVISFGNQIDVEFEIKFEKKNIEQNPDAVINLAEQIAIDKNIKLVVCLDEFQNISEFDSGINFQKKLRSHWQHHKNVVYILYGSKMSMMSVMFAKQKYPFYKFGDIIFLKKIEAKHLVNHVSKIFNQTNKKIDQTFAKQLVETMECHPHYVQHLAYFVWHKTSEEVTSEIISESLEMLINSYAPMFQRIFEDLTKTQVNYLKAIAQGHKDGFTSKELIETYEFGTGANVLRAVTALEKKEIIDSLYSKTEFLDPVFKIWFKRIVRA
ncbi:MAG: hypothetical protein SFY32_10620 [Bacteroidota bacterium]|nr:hypothetical protein [Bacteroidota bacterium]